MTELEQLREELHKRDSRIAQHIIDECKASNWSWFAAVLVLFGIIVLLIIGLSCTTRQINSLESEVRSLENKMHANELFWTEEYTELEAAAEWLQKDYGRLEHENNRLKNQLTQAPYTAEYVQQMVLDYDEVFDYQWNYRSYIERNPDVSFEEYLKLKAPELYERLMEYSKRWGK